MFFKRLKMMGLELTSKKMTALISSLVSKENKKQKEMKHANREDKRGRDVKKWVIGATSMVHHQLSSSQKRTLVETISISLKMVVIKVRRKLHMSP
jgi:hypothetical protein